MRRTSRPVLPAAICFAVLYSTVVMAQASSALGVVSLVSGDVKLSRNNGVTWAQAEPENELFQGDMLKTMADSQAVVVFEEGSVIKLAPMTVIQFSKLNYKQRGSKENRESTMSLQSGTVYAQVSKLSPGDFFEVQTPFAVAGVRGTEFMVSADDKAGDSEVNVFEGEVEVQSTDKRFNRRYKVGANRRLRVLRDKLPADPAQLAPEQKQKLMERIRVLRKQGDPKLKQINTDHAKLFARLRSLKDLPPDQAKRVLMLLKSGKLDPAETAIVVEALKKGMKPIVLARLIGAVERGVITKEQLKKILLKLEKVDPEDINEKLQQLMEAKQKQKQK